ncbi:hypothetical protein [uncultured Piscinibacter sp.]|uniref:hypothetical protein n=1 Tax=uncultured Piscinibacter sp. TaxID=1131835 RepID=UPI00260E5DDE|nr:hypothetical protein [uncultured Piscinibacter sp.]
MPDPTTEHWRTDVADADVATLDIPPSLTRSRRFHVDVRFVVRCPDDPEGAWHALTVELDGRQRWSRRIPTSNPGQTDSLDYHCTVELPEGAGLRVRAVTQVRGAVRRQLRIDAEEP